MLLERVRVIYVSTKTQGGMKMDRKETIKQLGEHFGVKPKYLSVPSFAYEIRTENEIYTIVSIFKLNQKK